MDLGTIIGIVAGIILLVGPIIMSGMIGAFIDMPSVYCTMGGMTAGILIAYPLPKIMQVFSATRKAIQAGSLDLSPWYQTVVELATIARRDGILALEERLPNISDEFLRRGLQMLVDGNPAETVTAILELEIENMEARHQIGHSIWKSQAAYAPAFGMIGTLIGLVQMLQDMSDPSKIGQGMAVALLTTLYGAFWANLFATPLQAKLEQRTAEEVQLKKMLLAGILAVQAGDSPRVVGDKLMVYLTPTQRATILAASAK